MSSSAIYFFNWTDEKFTYPWNNEPYEFAPKQRMLFPEGIAWHFAKHLAEHHYNKDNVAYNLAQLAETIEKGLIRDGGVTGVSDEKMRILAMNSKDSSDKAVKESASEVKPKKKAGRPKKAVEVTEAPKEVVKEDLAEFAGK